MGPLILPAANTGKYNLGEFIYRLYFVDLSRELHQEVCDLGRRRICRKKITLRNILARCPLTGSNPEVHSSIQNSACVSMR